MRNTEELTGPTVSDLPSSHGVVQRDLLDRYLILGELGRGGMGQVMRAYDPALKRELAVKVVRVRGEAAEAARVRLLREAQALARLSHPNVIVVHDVGTRGDEVFVAMELIEGQTLRRWLDDKPAPERVLEVLRKAGEGLAAAHDAGLVHRDFKPDNVMIGNDGRVRVLDFGLARDVSADAEAAPVGSPPAGSLSAGAWMGTPRYMAPEQWRREVVDARADQFAFCVTAYEAFYGGQPFAGETMEERVENAADGKIVPSPRDGFGGERLFKVLARGLAPDAAARWPSLRELLAALEPPRSRRALAGGLFAVAALAATVGLAVAGGHADPCAAAAARVDAAWSSAARAKLAAGFNAAGLPDGARLLSTALDGRAAGLRTRHLDTCKAMHVGGTRSPALLDRRMACLGRRVDELDGFVARAAGGETEVLLDALERVEQLPPVSICDDDDALLREVPLPDDPGLRARVAELDKQLAGITGRRGLDPDDALLARLAGLWPAIQALAYPPIEAHALYLRALIENEAGKFKEAAATLGEAARAAARARDDRTLARVWVALIDVRGRESAGTQVLTLEPVAQAAIDRAGAADLQGTLDITLGWTLREDGHFDEARARYQLVIDRLTPAGDSNDLGRALMGLGVVAKEQGKLDEAVTLYQRAIDVYTRTVGADHPLTATAVNNLAVALRRQGKLPEARAAWERVLAIYKRTRPPDHPDFAPPLANLGNLSVQEGKLDEGRERLEAARAIFEKTLGPRSLRVGTTSADLAFLYWRLERMDDAVAAFERAVSIIGEVNGPDSVQVAMPRHDLAELYLVVNKPQLALEQSTRALAIYAKRDDEPRVQGKMEFTQGKALWATGGDHGKALALVRGARDRFKALGANSTALLAETEDWLAHHE